MSEAQELPCELEPRSGPAEAILGRRSSRKDSEREQSEQTNFLEGLWLFAPLVKNEAHGQKK